MMKAQHLIVSLLVFILAFEASYASPSFGAKITKEKEQGQIYKCPFTRCPRWINIILGIYFFKKPDYY